MKKIAFILLAVSAMILASCAKEANIEENKNIDPQFTGKTITFTASIELQGATKADLDGLALKWESSDKIGVITDQGGTIQVCDVVPDPDPEKPTQCSFTVDAVAGATTYYFIYTGHSTFDNITFNTSTATFSGFKYTPKSTEVSESFSGLGVGNQQVGENTIESNNYYGSPLSMAGKATVASDATEVSGLVMVPCLALVKLKVDEESVTAKYGSWLYHNNTYNKDHQHYYTGVRGFQLTQKGFSRSSGAFSVNLSGDNMVVSPVASLGDYTDAQKQDKAYRDKSSSSLLSKDKEYLMCVIPGGSISGFDIFFYGYTSAEANSWDAQYPMSLSKSLTVKPGDFINLGTLNPVGLQKVRDKAADDAADEAEASATPFVPAIDIDGSFDDWTTPKTGVTIYSFDNDNAPGSSSANRLARWKVTSDEQFIYIYYEIGSGKINNSKYIYTGLDINADNTGGGSVGGSVGGTCEVEILIYPFVSDSDPVECYAGNERGHIKYNSTTVGKATVNGEINGNAFIEASIPRNLIGSPASNVTINACHSYYDGYTTGWHTFNLK